MAIHHSMEIETRKKVGRIILRMAAVAVVLGMLVAAYFEAFPRVPGGFVGTWTHSSVDSSTVDTINIESDGELRTNFYPAQSGKLSESIEGYSIQWEWMPSVPTTPVSLDSDEETLTLIGFEQDGNDLTFTKTD